MNIISVLPSYYPILKTLMTYLSRAVLISHYKSPGGTQLFFGTGRYVWGGARLSSLTLLQTGTGIVPIDPTVKDFVYTFFTFFFLQTCHEGDLSFPYGLLIKFGCGCH